MSEFGFLPINVSTLVPTTALGMDLYQISDETQRPVLFRGGDYPLELSDIERLRDRGVDRLYIATESRDTYQTYLCQLALGDESSGPVPIAARIDALNEIVRDVLKRAFIAAKVDETIAVAQELAELACSLVCHAEFDARDLFRVLHHDYTTFTHSANVAWYCAILAKSLGYSEADITEITMGGLLHDLGKLEIPKSILCKPGRLDDAEFRVVKKHPTVGFRRLFHREELSFGQMMMVYQHHERLDGRGYPVGALSESIHPWAKLCSVVDVFEALTSERPYRKPMPRRVAIDLLQRDIGTAFDSEMVQCWIATIQTGSANS